MPEGSWSKAYRLLVAEFLRETSSFTGDDLQHWMTAKGLPPPSNPNQWGSLFRDCIAKSPFVIKTGKAVPSRGEKAKGRANQVWKSMICQDGDRLVTLNQQLCDIRALVLQRKIDIHEALRRAAEAGASSLS
jgi:hypothetical protein